MNFKIIRFSFLKKVLVFYSVFSLFILLRAYIFSNLYYFNLKPEPLFFSEYILGHIFLSFWTTIGIGIVNLYLLYRIGLHVYSPLFGFFLALLYAISPWSAYVDIFGENNVYLLGWLLVFVLSTILFKQNHKYSLLFLFSSLVGLITASIFGLFILTILLLIIYNIGYLPYKNLIKLYMLTLASIFIVICMLFSNTDATKNLIKINARFFQDIGIINTVNELRGETNSTGFSRTGKIVENRYLYIGEKLLLNFSMIFSPSLFFTPQFKLFDFSFSPPVFLGFIIPFISGILVFTKQKKYLFASIVAIAGLSLPSVVGKNTPDLAKLIIISPIIYMYIASGLVRMTDRIRGFKYPGLLLLMLFLVVVQMLVVIADIGLRERTRFEIFYNQFS